MILRGIAARYGWSWFWQCYIGLVSIPLAMASAWMLIPSRKWAMAVVGCSFALYVVHPFPLLLLVSIGVTDAFAGAASALALSFAIAFALRLCGKRICGMLFGGR